MKKFLYLGIFLLLISCNSYAADYEEVTYTLKNIEEGVSLTHPENFTHGKGTYSTLDLRFNDFYPIGFYKGRYYWGFQYDCIPYRNNGVNVYGRLAGLAYYDINTEAMKFVKLPYEGAEATSSSTKSMSLKSKLITDNYSYTKAVEINNNRTITLENGMLYCLQRPYLKGEYRYDDSRQEYFPESFKVKKFLEGVRIGPNYTSSGYYSTGKFPLTGITSDNKLVAWDAIYLESFASNVKNASMLDTSLRSNIAVLQLDGKLYRFTTQIKNGDYYRYDYDIAEKVLELNGLYFVKDIGNEKWTICKLSDDGTSYTEMLTLSANSFSLDDLDDTYLQVGTKVYDLTSKSTAKSPKYTDVKDYVSGYILKTNGDVYKGTTKISGLSNITKIVNGYASDSSNNVYSFSGSSVSKLSGIKGQLKKAQNDSNGDVGNFILLEDGKLYRYGTYITSVDEDSVYKEEKTMKLFKSGVIDFYISQSSSESALTVLDDKGKVWFMGYNRYGFNGNPGGYSGSSDNESYRWDLELKELDLLEQCSGNIWIEFKHKNVLGELDWGTYNYNLDLERQQTEEQHYPNTNYNYYSSFPYELVYSFIPSNKLISKKVLYNGIKVDKKFIQKADMAKELDIAADDILLRNDGKIGVICKFPVKKTGLPTQIKNDDEYWYDYRIVWVNINEEKSTNLSFTTEEYKSLQGGVVHLEISMSDMDNAEEIINNITDKIIIVDKLGNKITNLLKAAFDIKKDATTGTYSFKVAVGGAECFKEITSSLNDRYTVVLEVVTSSLSRFVENFIAGGKIIETKTIEADVNSESTQKVEAKVEVIPLFDVT